MRVASLPFFILVIAFANPAFAAELNLDEALKRSRDYWLPQLQDTTIEAQTSVRLALSRILPDVSASAVAQKEYLNAAKDPAQGSGSVSVSEKLIDISAWKLIGARGKSREAAYCDIEARMLEIHRSVVEEYYGLSLLMDQEEFLTKQLERGNKSVQLLRETTRLRFAAQTDLLSAEAQVSRLKIQISQLMADRTASLNRLKALLGAGSEEEVLPSRTWVQKNTFRLEQAPSWSEALPDTLSLLKKSEASEKEASSAGWQLFPALTLSGTYTNPHLLQDNASRNTLVGLMSLTIPLFDQGVRLANQSRSNRLADVYRAQYEQRKIQNQHHLDSLVVQRRESITQLEQVSKLKGLAEKAYSSAWTLLSIGKREYIAIRIVEDEQLNAQLQWASVQRRLDRTNATLQLYFQATERAKAKSEEACVL